MKRSLATLSFIALIGLGSCQFRSASDLPLTPTAAGTLEVSIATGADDVQELAFGKLIQSDPTLELSQVGEVVALRFTGIDVPQGAGITKAYLSLTAARGSDEAGTFAIRAEAADNSAPIPTEDSAVRGLAAGYTSASWETGPWTQGERVESIEVSPVVAEVVAREGWAAGGSMTFVLTGIGGAMQTAAAFELIGSQPATLHLEYDTSVPNTGYGGGYLPLGPIVLPEESCLKLSTGPLTTITGFKKQVIAARYLTDARIDGRGMRVRSPLNPFVGAYNEGSFCLSGGILTSQYPFSTDWDTTHNVHGMYWVDTPNITVEYMAIGVDNQIVGDGISFKQNTPNWIFRDSYVQRAGDDGIENDRYNNGLADNIMIDSAFQGMSCRSEGKFFEYDRPYHFTVQNSLIALDPVRSHQLIKYTIARANMCHISLKNNIFLLPKGAGLINPNDHPNIKEPLLIESDCAGAKNTVVYTGNDKKYLEYLRGASPACFEVTTDRSVWEAARNDWFERHPMFKVWQ